MIKKFLIFFLICGGIWAQDFGFGFDDDAAAETFSPVFSVKIGGEIAAEFSGYVHDFSSADKIKIASLGDIVSGSLNFNASGANVDAFIGLNLSAAGIPDNNPFSLNEAYLRAFFGSVVVEAGLRKLTWGKADSFGPLDIINPLDYTDLRNMADIQSVKIARPLARVSWNPNGFSKLEAVFIPSFTGHRFVQEGRWTPSQYKNMLSVSERGISSRADELLGAFAALFDYDALFAGVKSNLVNYLNDNPVIFPSTTGLEYLQTGLRFTTTAGPADIGMQYFYGNFFLPGFTIDGIDYFLNDLASGNNPLGPLVSPYYGDPGLLSPQIRYNRYHQIGFDYAQVLAGLNVRSELALHITDDLKGDDGAVRNPFLAWSLGFDRDLFLGINANVQCNETIRLMNKKIGSNPVLDCEAETDMTSTRITMRLSRKFLRDELESRATIIWDVENSGCYIIPALEWNIRDLTAELSAGIFSGKESGELGQYWENSFVKLGIKYSF